MNIIPHKNLIISWVAAKQYFKLKNTAALSEMGDSYSGVILTIRYQQEHRTKHIYKPIVLIYEVSAEERFELYRSPEKDIEKVIPPTPEEIKKSIESFRSKHANKFVGFNINYRLAWPERYKGISIELLNRDELKKL